MRYDAITLDTNIFTDNGYRLESGLLAELSQFKNDFPKFVLSEVVQRELRRHLVAAVSEQRTKLLTAAKRAKNAQLLPQADLDTITRICEAAATPDETVSARLKSFAAETGMQIIGTTDIALEAVLQRYFSTSPPFEPHGEKKKEFPDAIALMSLEKWATENNFRVLAVSKDGGWSSFAQASEHIVVVKDLKEALSVFQEQHTQARAFVTSLIDAARSGQAGSFVSELKDTITKTLSLVDLTAYFRTDEEVNYDSIDAAVTDIELSTKSGEASVSIVRTGANKIVFTVLAKVTIHASTEFTFIAWDEDHGQRTYESHTEEVEDWFKTDLLIELHTLGFFPEIVRVEMVDIPREIDFGRVESLSHYDARHD